MSITKIWQKKILIIDDEPDIIKMVIDQLTAEGFDTASASDGESGYYKAFKVLPDVILMDVEMPGWNGIYTADQLHSEHATTNIPIIFLTGLGDESIPVKYLEQRNYFVLIKPFRAEELLAILSNNLGMQGLTTESLAGRVKPSLDINC